MGSKLAGADHLCNTCLLYPVSAFWQLMPGEMETAKSLRDQLYNVTRTLFEEHVEFDVIDDETLIRCEIRDGMIRCGDESYKAIVVPDRIRFLDIYIQRIKLLEGKGIAVIYANDEGFIDIAALKNADAIWTFVSGSGSDSDHKNLMLLKKRIENDTLVYAFNNSEKPGSFAMVDEKADYCYMYDAKEDKFFNMQPEEKAVHFGLQGYAAIMMLLTDREIPDAPFYSMSDEMIPAVFEYETNPEWDYNPPKACIYSIRMWDISLCSPEYRQNFSEQPFCLIRNIAGTELNYIKKLNVRPIFDSAKVVNSIYPVEAVFRASFNIPQQEHIEIHGISLLIESDTLQGDCKIFINGNELSMGAFVRKPLYDYYNLMADVGEYIKPGRNELRLVWPSAGEFDGLKSAMYII